MCRTKKSRQKFKYLENEKSIFNDEKAFFIIFKGLSLKPIKLFFGRRESDVNTKRFTKMVARGFHKFSNYDFPTFHDVFATAYQLLFLKGLETFLLKLVFLTMATRPCLKEVFAAQQGMFPFRQILCPALIQLLGSPANDVSTRGNSIGYSGYPDEGRGARAVNGNGNKFPSPLIARSIYTIAGELVRLVGTLFSLRPTLESLFHRIILYPPPQHRIEALKVLKEVSCLTFLLITSNLKPILNSFARKSFY